MSRGTIKGDSVYSVGDGCGNIQVYTWVEQNNVKDDGPNRYVTLFNVRRASMHKGSSMPQISHHSCVANVILDG